MKTVGELKAFLELNKISPETMAKEINISNMTIRRLLKRPSKTRLPEKYIHHFNYHLVQSVTHHYSQDWNVLMGDLEREGDNLKTAKSFSNFMEDVKKKLGGLHHQSVEMQVKQLMSCLPLKSGKTRSIVLGALIYFVNPLDCIPDMLTGLGYVDDLGVISVVIGLLGPWNNEA